MTITASWSNASVTTPTVEMRGVTAVAASLPLPARTTEDAAVLAEREGLATHLTSLVLVDEAGDIQETVPATRKVHLPSPRTHIAAAREIDLHDTAAEQYSIPCSLSDSFGELLSSLIDWDLAPRELQSGDLSTLPIDLAEAIREGATIEDVVALARTLDLDPVGLIVGLLAHAARSHRTAARIARAIFGGEPPADAFAVFDRWIERLSACSSETSGRN
jgi:hypothetical protein